MAMPTDDDAANGCISGNYCICERGGTLAGNAIRLLGMLDVLELYRKIPIKQNEFCVVGIFLLSNSVAGLLKIRVFVTGESNIMQSPREIFINLC